MVEDPVRDERVGEGGDAVAASAARGAAQHVHREGPLEELGPAGGEIGGLQGALSHAETHRNVTATASVKLDVSVGFASRCQSWKYQVENIDAATRPVGVGIAARSMGSATAPMVPEFTICPGPT